MKKQLLKVKSNTALANGVYRMELESAGAGLDIRPGQFINIKIDGCCVSIATADGSFGVKGFVTGVMKSLDYDYIYTCGPEPMLKAVFKECRTSGQFSFEERMGCGFGACMGCSCKTVTGYKRICKDGPVLCKEEILWED